MAPLETINAKQGNVVPFSIVEGPDAWYAKDYENNKEWVYELTDEDILELEAATQHNLHHADNIENITIEDFVLPSLSQRLEAMRQEATHGRGFVVVRGVPVWRWSRVQTMIAYWGIGLYWGRAVSQNKKGHFIGHIKDIGHDPTNPETRLYATHAAQPWHNDASDLVSLLCLTPAKEGGLSSWSSSITVHNEILRQAPHLAKVLAAPCWFFDRKGEVPDGKLPYFMIPVFNYYKGYLSVNFSDNYYFASQRHADVPRLTPDQLEAINLFNKLAASKELRMDMYLQPGDIQLLSNHTCLHTRTEFTDDAELDQRRHLLRLWLSPESDRPLPQVYGEILGGSVEIGRRGGIRVEGQSTRPVPLEAE